MLIEYNMCRNVYFSCDWMNTLETLVMSCILLKDNEKRRILKFMGIIGPEVRKTQTPKSCKVRTIRFCAK